MDRCFAEQLTAALLLTVGLAGPASALPGSGSDADGRIAFADDRTGNFQLYTVRPDGSGLRQLTSTAGHDSFNGGWSPDGRKLVFVRVRPETQGSAIYVMNADGSATRALTDDQAHNGMPAWSPDGNPDLWVMDADGTDLVDITPDPSAQFVPDWGPARP